MTDKFTAELDRIERLHRAATEGPWTTETPSVIASGPAKGFRDGTIVAATYRGQNVYAKATRGNRPEADRSFIADARTSNPRLERMVRAQRAVNKFSDHNGYCDRTKVRLGLMKADGLLPCTCGFEEAESALAELERKDEWT